MALMEIPSIPRKDGACLAISPGIVDYRAAFALQRRLHDRVAADELPGVLLLLEHPHVYTLGRRGSRDDILVTQDRLAELGVEVHDADRGGEVTYHGPGQLVGYPIVNLRKWGGGPLRFIRALEEVLIVTLNEFGIEAGSEERPTGVWVGDAKISAIGVKVSRGVATHGFALNVGPDLSYFDHIVPCGMPDGRVASMESVLGKTVSVRSVIPVVARQFGRIFGLDVTPMALADLGETVEEPAPAGAGNV
jgi:lipoate-protein ligase B